MKLGPGSEFAAAQEVDISLVCLCDVPHGEDSTAKHLLALSVRWQRTHDELLRWVVHSLQEAKADVEAIGVLFECHLPVHHHATFAARLSTRPRPHAGMTNHVCDVVVCHHTWRPLWELAFLHRVEGLSFCLSAAAAAAKGAAAAVHVASLGSRT